MAEEVEMKGNSILMRTAQALFRSAIPLFSFAPYDVTPDGKKFVINAISEQNSRLTLDDELDGKSEEAMTWPQAETWPAQNPYAHRCWWYGFLKSDG